MMTRMRGKVNVRTNLAILGNQNGVMESSGLLVLIHREMLTLIKVNRLPAQLMRKMTLPWVHQLEIVLWLRQTRRNSPYIMLYSLNSSSSAKSRASSSGCPCRHSSSNSILKQVIHNTHMKVLRPALSRQIKLRKPIQHKLLKTMQACMAPNHSRLHHLGAIQSPILPQVSNHNPQVAFPLPKLPQLHPLIPHLDRQRPRRQQRPHSLVCALPYKPKSLQLTQWRCLSNSVPIHTPGYPS